MTEASGKVTQPARGDAGAVDHVGECHAGSSCPALIGVRRERWQGRPERRYVSFGSTSLGRVKLTSWPSASLMAFQSAALNSSTASAPVGYFLAIRSFSPASPLPISLSASRSSEGL